MEYIILAFEYLCQESLLNAYLHNIRTAIFFLLKILAALPQMSRNS